jgi:hypothetical protein
LIAQKKPIAIRQINGIVLATTLPEVGRFMVQANMEPVIADLAKLRSLLDRGWKFYSINWRGLSESPFRTTVLLKAGKRELQLQSDDDEFCRFCAKQTVSVDENGDAAFRGIADLTRYHSEAFGFVHDLEGRLKTAFQLV